MTKTELIDVIAADAGTTKKAVSEILNLFIAQIRMTEKITIPGFGTFKNVVKPAHEARNPITGKPVNVPEKNRPEIQGQQMTSESFKWVEVPKNEFYETIDMQNVSVEPIKHSSSVSIFRLLNGDVIGRRDTTTSGAKRYFLEAGNQ